MMAGFKFALDELHAMVGGKLGKHDLPCPACSPGRSSPKKRQLPVLAIWLLGSDFATFNCMHCGIHGEAHASGRGNRVDRDAIRRALAESTTRDRETAAAQLGKARWIWRQRLAIPGTIVERYLREVRGYGGPIPATLAYLPPRGQHGAAMVAAYGIPLEPEPGHLVMQDEAIAGIQLTKLTSEG